MTVASFRAGVVLVIRNSVGQVMAFERCDESGQWQLPQGGIDKGERPVDAAWRELGEETSLGSNDVTLVAEHPYWTVYEWPSALSRKGRIGQAHRWFFFDVISDDVVATPDQHEFCNWKWMNVADLIDIVVGFRKQPYRQVLGDG